MKKKIQRLLFSDNILLRLAVTFALFAVSFVLYNVAIYFIEEYNMSSWGEIPIVMVTVLVMVIGGILFIGTVGIAIRRLFIGLFKSIVGLFERKSEEK